MIEQLRAGETEAVSVAWLPGDAGDVTEMSRTRAEALPAVASAPTVTSMSRNKRKRMSETPEFVDRSVSPACQRWTRPTSAVRPIFSYGRS